MSREKVERILSVDLMELKNAILMKNDKPMCRYLWGPEGVGKSELINSWMDEIDIEDLAKKKIYYFKLNLKDIENTGRYGYWEIWQKLIMQFKETIPKEAYEYEADTIENIFALLENSIEEIVEEYDEDTKGCIDDLFTAFTSAKIHIKIDTGMTRIGFCANDDSVKEIYKISKLDNIEIEGLFSHFSKADEDDKNPTHIQFEKFTNIKNKLIDVGVTIPISHICNSAGIIDFPEYQLDMVRSGIITYGHYPSECVNHKKINLTPAMTFKTLVANINQIDKGISVGYGGTFVADKKMKIATILAGYADGYSRFLSNKADVLINGERCRVVGRVCMDQTMVDVSKLKNINLGDEVILFGKSGNNIVTVEEVAKIIGTINYEVLCAVSKRVPRIYIRGA